MGKVNALMDVKDGNYRSVVTSIFVWMQASTKLYF